VKNGHFAVKAAARGAIPLLAGVKSKKDSKCLDITKWNVILIPNPPFLSSKFRNAGKWGFFSGINI
jgi:hypothetical protein